MRKGPSFHFLGGGQDVKDQVCLGCQFLIQFGISKWQFGSFRDQARDQRVGMVPNDNLRNGRSGRVRSGLPRPGAGGEIRSR